MNVSEQDSSNPKQNKAESPSSCVFYRYGKHQRLLSPKDYSTVFDNAPIRASHSNFLLLARINTTTNAKLGLVISKKNVKHAVTRNTIKRIARETFRLQQHNIPAIDVIVLARRGADTVPKDQLSSIFNGLWKRIIKQAKTPTSV